MKIVLLYLFCLFFLSKPPLREGITYSQAVYDEEQTLLRLTLSSDEKYRLYTPLEEISPLFVETTLLQEDQYFFQHLGVNPLALLKAAWQTYGLQSRKIGASTITMQVARMRYKIPSRTFAGKLWQIVKALQLELFYSKKEILEAYFNLASYGGNIEGVGAASLIYFEKPASQLNLFQSLRLSVIPQNPKRRAQSLEDLQKAYMLLLKRWNAPPLQNLAELPPQLTKKKLPFHAPHFVEGCLRTHHQHQVITTLNLKLQKLMEKIVRQYLEQHRENGVENSSALLIHIRDREVKAAIGSANYFDPSIAGQVNGTQAKRSPGSTLKPFIYALAMDQGLIHPYTVLKDTPQSFGDYTPENFEKDFLGPLKAKDALVLSRNIPAISLARQLKNPDLYQFLEHAHIKKMKPKADYGLSIALGSAEVTMEELAALYTMLANGGVWHPLLTQKQAQAEGARLLTPEASFLTLDMLKDTSPTGIPVYWKTGTSSGYRDAWAVGLFGPYVLAVWIGDFTNKSPAPFIGQTSAAPLFFQLIDAICQHRELPDQLTPPPNLTRVEVCEASGCLPNPHCPHTVSTWFIPGKSPIKTDTLHGEGEPPQILSPQAGVIYTVRLPNAAQLIAFKAIADKNVTTLYWFLNNQLIGKSPRDQPLFWEPKPGSYRVRVVDNEGRIAMRDLVVKTVE